MQKAFGGTVSYDAGFQVEYDGGPGKYVKTSGFYCMNGSEKRYLAGKDVRKALDNFNAVSYTHLPNARPRFFSPRCAFHPPGQ